MNRTAALRGTLHFGFLLMGFGCTVVQTLLIRELLVAFFGNELVIGLILGCWFVVEAVGSGLLGRLASRGCSGGSHFAFLQVLFALFLPVCLYAANVGRSLVGGVPGEGVGLVPIGYTALLVLAPLALIDGAMFAFGCWTYARLSKDQISDEQRHPLSIGRVYVCEAVGAIAGGVVFTYLFIPLLESLSVALLLSSMNLLSAALLLALSSPPSMKQLSRAFPLVAIATLLICEIICLLSPYAEALQSWLVSQRWAGQNLVYSGNSVYGNVAAVQTREQYTFYTNGIPTLNAPVPDVVLSEEMVHLPLLFVSQIRRALVLSGGIGGVLSELLKYPLERVDYAELDPLLIEAVRRFPTPLTEGELGDPRVQVETVDGRFLVRQRAWEYASQSGEIYDLILINLPYPSTLQINRLYTMEFFELTRKLLSREGIIAIGCPGTLGYLSPELRNLNAMVFHTLKKVFPYVRPIPGELTLWLASSSPELLTVPVESLAARWEGHAIETLLMSTGHVRYKLDQRRLEWFQNALGQGDNGGRYVNRDLHPIGLFYGLLYWNALFSPEMGVWLNASAQIRVWHLALPIAAGTLLVWGMIKRTREGRKAVVPIVIVTTGFVGMAADLLIIFAFQTLYGYIYSWTGLLISAFMVGAGLGGLIMTTRLPTTINPHRTLLKLESMLLGYWVALPITLGLLYSQSAHPIVFDSIRWILLALNVIAGFLVGCQFPLANSIWLKGLRREEGAAGFLYACDLAGAFLGSVVVPVITVPVLGILQTCLIAAVLKVGSLALAFIYPANS